MSYSNSDWVQAVAKLLEITSKEIIKWAPTKEYSEGNTERVDRAFESRLNSNRYVVKRYQIQSWYDEDPESYHWNGPYYGLDIYRANVFEPELVASAPEIPMVRDLFNKADSMYAFQTGILDDLLKPNIFE
ncbi:hypothetical protein [Rhizobium sp. M1]|uniref:hypothetical protein n=1 Tax=Rhizobium sp. M1 TaxID=2035453 RepID=UPI000BEAE658|nr:hypothetical protein [Rhizobium sp. M1]PDT06940.1 hypothetical protein CO655_29865 [Rhizobium sp. M1]